LKTYGGSRLMRANSSITPGTAYIVEYEEITVIDRSCQTSLCKALLTMSCLPRLPATGPLRIFTDMRFAQDSFAINSIRAYSDGEITVNDKTIAQSVLITPDSIQPWEPRNIGELTAEHIDQLGKLDPELVIIGTGKTLMFPPPELTAALLTRDIGVEIMTHDAACRTFNVLLAEDRRVVVALMMGSSES